MMRSTGADRLCVLLYVVLAVAIGFVDLRTRAHTAHVVDVYIPAVVANTESAPGRYRVLAPFVINGVAERTGMSLQNTWYVTRLLFIFLAFCAMHVYLRVWFPPEAALAGVALTAATLPLTFTNSWPHPDAMPELALFALGAFAAARRRHGLFAVALALAALNRETSAFLVLLFAVAEPMTRRRAGLTLLFALEWFGIYAGLRLARGLSHYEYWQAARNLSDLGLLPEGFDPYYRAYAYFGILLFAPLVALALRARGAPPFMRRVLVVVPCFVAVAFLFSSIIESRIFTPLYALTLPGALFSLFSPSPGVGAGRP